MDNEHQRLYTLTEHILSLMQNKGGAISFYDWMQAALYQPKLGYYESESIFGKAGDFTTAAAMGSWLSMGFAESINKAWQAMGKPVDWTLLEQGGGNGDLLCNTLDQLVTLGLIPPHIIAVETSAQLRQRQANNFVKHGVNIQQTTHLQDIKPVKNLIMFSNELPDAFPVRAFSYKQQQTIERGVDWDGEKFIWTDLQPLHTPITSNIQAQWQEGYISEFNPNLQSWQETIANIADKAVILTVDYGYTQQEYYRATRIEGTLMGHYKHQVVEDVLKLSPGVCDITAHIDFTALKKAGEDVGLQTIAYTTQGAWLAQSQAVQQHMQTLAANPSVDNIAQITQAKRLMLPTGMGESFKLLIQSKGINKKDSQTLVSPAFDRLHTL
ncbi:MAG: SAM-dependent methyltransferase [Ghiorsea sp.]|nr:SAM-dependent methyltransferase [Ghiorsea sp.]